MRTILHLSCDFPDPIVPAKTRGVLNYIENTPGFRHVVYSLNRASWKSNIVSVPFGPDRVAVAYGAPPKAILLHTRLRVLAEWIRDDLKAKGIVPDLIHAHKLTVEGLVARDLHRALGIPYICSIWGDTDLKFLKMRRDLRPRWREVVADASRLLPVAPWTADRFAREFDLDPAKMAVILPIVKHETFRPTRFSGRADLVTLFNLNAYKRKNLPGLIRSVAAVRKDVPNVTLDIFGSGDAISLCEIETAIEAAGASDFVKIRGPLPQDGFAEALNRYTAFVMPTARETFGMVFVEALFCGLPVLYTQNWSIDGLFPADQIGYAWNGQDEADIARGLLHLIHEERNLKAGIDAMARAGAFEPMRCQSIIAAYTDVLNSTAKADPEVSPC